MKNSNVSVTRKQHNGTFFLESSSQFCTLEVVVKSAGEFCVLAFFGPSDNSTPFLLFMSGNPTLIKVAFPDEFSCRHATLQVKPGDTVGAIKAKLVTKYASKIEKPEEFDLLRGSQVWREDEAINAIGKDLLSIRRRSPGSPVSEGIFVCFIEMSHVNRPFP